jgi:NDP-sugar pyrophosphorylase family protein
LTRIVEKPRPGTEPSDLVNILLHLHTDVRELLQYISKVRTTSDDVYECAVDSMVQDNRKIKVVRYDRFWAPIKYPRHIFNVVRHFLDSGARRIPSSASIADSAVVSGNVVLGDNVRVLENAAIKGPVYIGSNTVVGNNALVREYSHIGAGCVVGFSTEIKGSYVGDNCWFHSSYIGDSVIGSNCSFGAGAVTANFRFDEKAVGVRYADAAISTGRDHFGAIIGDNCRIGINAGILPGRRVGPNSIVGSHVCLSDDLEPGMVITGQPKYHLARQDVHLGKREEELQGETGGRDA